MYDEGRTACSIDTLDTILYIYVGMCVLNQHVDERQESCRKVQSKILESGNEENYFTLDTAIYEAYDDCVCNIDDFRRETRWLRYLYIGIMNVRCQTYKTAHFYNIMVR